MSNGITPKDFSINDRLGLMWLLLWPNFRWSGFAMYRQQQVNNVRHDLISTPCPEALRDQIAHCPVRRTWRFLPALVVMLLVHVSLEVCVIVNGRYRCENDQSFNTANSDSIGPWSSVLRIFGHTSVGALSLLIPLTLFLKYRAVQCQYVFVVNIVRDWFVFLYSIPIIVFAVYTILSAVSAKSYLCDRPPLIPTLIGFMLLLFILSFNFTFCALNLRLGVFINQCVSPPACTGHVCPLIELARQGKHEPSFYLVYTQLPDCSWGSSICGTFIVCMLLFYAVVYVPPRIGQWRYVINKVKFLIIILSNITRPIVMISSNTALRRRLTNFTCLTKSTTNVTPVASMTMILPYESHLDSSRFRNLV